MSEQYVYEYKDITVSGYDFEKNNRTKNSTRNK